MDQQEFYLNQPTNNECIKLPGRDRVYLLKSNYLSEFFTEDEKAEARFNLGITPLLNELKALVYQNLTDEAGNLKFGEEPTNGQENPEAYTEVLSSAVIYNTLLKYYTKEQLDGWMQNLEERMNVLRGQLEITVDEELDANSTNPVQNKAIVQSLSELNAAYNRLQSVKANREELLNYNTIDEINILLEDLRRSLTEYADTKDVDLTVFYTKEQTAEILQNYATNQSVQQSVLDILQRINTISGLLNQQGTDLGALTQEVNGIKEDIQNLDQDIQNVQNLSGNVDTINRTVSEMEQTVNALSGTVGELNQAVGGISETINQTVNQSLEQIDQTIDSIQEDIEDVKFDIDNIKEDINELKDTPKHVFLTQAQYEALLAYDDNTLYFIIESSSEGSQFGDTFPLTFG